MSAPITAPAPAPAVPAPAPAAAATSVPVPPTIFHTTGPWVAGALYVVVPSAPLLAIPEETPAFGDSSPLWYCITRGHFVGCTLSNSLALNATLKVSGSAMKSYKSQALALAAFNDSLGYQMITVIPRA